MQFVCQQDAIDKLKLLAGHDRHGILIVGNPGGGKSYVASQYAKMLQITDFYKINPVIADLKTMIDNCVSNAIPVVICIENLDDGVAQASYPLLKLIEDCPSYIYVVVTCNNLFGIPPTILSRCAMVKIYPPTRSDIDAYAKAKNPTAFEFLHKHKVWGCIRGFTETDEVLKFTPEHLRYYDRLSQVIEAKDTVSNISWKLQHYDDNSEAPVAFVLKYLLNYLDGHKKKVCIDCLNDLGDNRISKNAVVSKLAFELQYTR